MSLPSIVGSFAVVQDAPYKKAYHATCTEEVLQVLVHQDAMNLPPQVLIDIQDEKKWSQVEGHPFFQFKYQQGFNLVTVTQLHQVPTL